MFLRNIIFRAEQRAAALHDNLKLTEEQLKESEMEKVSLADEVGTMKSDRDGLLERIDELEQEKSEELENLKRHLQTLKENAKQKVSLFYFSLLFVC